MPTMRARTVSLFLAALIAVVASGQTPAGRNSDRLFPIQYAGTEQDLQELATLVRAIAGIPNVSTDAANQTMTLGGTPDQIALAEWLVDLLDRPVPQLAQAPGQGAPEYRMPGSQEVVRVFFLTQLATKQDLQQVATVLRSTADIRRLFVLRAPRAIALRDHAGKAAMAEWLFHELNKPANWQPIDQRDEDLEPHIYRSPDNSDDVLQVFYLTSVSDPLEKIVQIRQQTEIPRAFFCATPKALTVRGTAAQLAQAGKLVEQLRH